MSDRARVRERRDGGPDDAQVAAGAVGRNLLTGSRVPALMWICFLALAPWASERALASEGGSSREARVYSISRTHSAIRVDGALDEDAWRNAVTVEIGYEVSPGENVAAPVRTEARLAYDNDALYVAFRAYDDRPSDVRARLTDRDPMPFDDAVGVMLDPFNDERRAVAFISNPLGVQTDFSRNDMSTEEEQEEDPSWDAIWSSAGRLTSEGYQVEIAIPFTSLRFPRAEGSQTWGFQLYRNYPRTVRHQLGSIPFDRGRNCIVCQYDKLAGFEGVTPGRSLELDPAFTMERIDETKTVSGDPPRAELGNGKPKGEPSLSMRWAVTPNWSLNGTLNPDFSQVEADAAQLTVNKRYAIFYPEKRPFFQEGGDFFATAIATVHTRTVVDPIWGVKLTGKEAGNAVGGFVTRDESTLLILPSRSAPLLLDEEITGGVLRLRADVGAGSTLGMIGTIREGGEYHNHVAGLDGHLRLGRSETLVLQALESSTRYPRGVAAEEGLPQGRLRDQAAVIGYAHETRDWSWSASLSEMGKDFRADAGFVPRVDTREKQVELYRTWWPADTDWITRASFGVEAEMVEDHDGTVTDEKIEVSVHADGRWQSYINPHFLRIMERYAGASYDLKKGIVRLGARPARAFNFWGAMTAGDGIDYENATPSRRSSGKLLYGGPGFAVDIGRHLQFFADHTYERLDVRGEKLYEANLIQSRLAYQMNIRMMARAIWHFTDVTTHPRQYAYPVDARSTELFTQLLLSYKVNPQTVFYLGYSEERVGAGSRRLHLDGRTFFGKVGYAWLL